MRLGVSIVVVNVQALAPYATCLYSRLYQYRQKPAQHDAAFERQKHAHDSFPQHRIQNIAKTEAHEDLNPSDAAHRIKHVMDGLKLDVQEREQFSVFDTLYEAVKDMATHDARKAVGPAERKRQDDEREQHEQKHKVAILASARVLE